MSVYVGFKIGEAKERKAYISEYYCGGCGWPVSDHDSYCPECGGAFRKEDATERTTTRNGKLKTKYGRKVPLCEQCGYAIGDRRYNYCPNCGAKVVM